MCSYTVDFHWGDYTYSIEGESEITLGELFEKLGVTGITTADVADVSFSNPDYIAIEQTGSDWLLRSLAPFQSEEALVLTLNNGQTVEIKVTDADGDVPQPEEQPTEKIDPAGTAPTAIGGLTYNGQAHELIEAGSTTGGTMLYSLGEDGEYSHTIPNATDAGDYFVYYKVQGNETYNDVAAQILNVTIAPKSVSVTADNKSKTYGEADPKLTATVDGLVGEDTIAHTVTRAQGEDAAEYAITVSGEAEQGNYIVSSFTAGTFTIAPKSVTVTADDKSKTYGEADPELTATVGGLVGEDTIAYTVTRAGAENAGRYDITPTGDETQGNYIVSYVPGTFTIAPKSVTVTADNKSKTYGADDPELTATVAGLVGEDTISYGLSRAEGEDLGAYDITPAGEKEQGNYIVSYVPGVLTIERIPVTVTADAADKTYGDPDPDELSVTVKGLLDGEMIKYTVSRTEGENAGEYIITVSGAAEQEYYFINYIDGIFTIKQRPLTITAASETKVYDGYVLSNEDYTVGGGLLEGHVVESLVHEGTQTDF